jgi:hypothetical protein
MKLLGIIVITAWTLAQSLMAQEKILLSLNPDNLKTDNISGLTNNLFKVKLHGSVNIVDGIKGKAIKFTNSKGYFSIQDLKGKLTPSDSLSVEFWIYPTQWSPKGDVIINKGWAKGWGISPRYLGNKVNFCAKIGNKRRDFIATKHSPTLNRWNHCVFTLSSKSGNFNFFLNGKLIYHQGHLRGKTLGKSSEPLRLGPYYPGTHIVIDELKIFNSILTSADVKENYNRLSHKIHNMPNPIKTVFETVKTFQPLSKVLMVNGIEFIKDGKAQGAIIIADNASDSIRFAADQLAFELKNGFGANFPVKTLGENTTSINSNNIFLGKNNHVINLHKYRKSIPPEGFQIFTTQNNLIICGNDNIAFHKGAGTLNGIYRFLETLGYRWYFPGQIGRVLPKGKTISVKNLDIIDSPWAPFRLCGYSAGLTNQWMWKVGFGSSVYPARTCHSFQNFHKMYKNSKPSIFALLNNGQRGQWLCWYTPDTTKLMIKQADSFFAKHKNDKYYPDFTFLRCDGAPPVCQCKKCLKMATPQYGPRGELSDYVTRKAIECSEILKNKYPDKRIIIGAYNKTILPPVSVAKLPQNVSVQIAKCSMLFWNKTTRKQYFDNILEGWLQKKPATISFWEYYNFDNWGNKKWLGVPGFCPELLANNIKTTAIAAKKYNIKVLGEYIFVNGRCDFQEGPQRLFWLCPNLYVTAKVLWNPKVSVKMLLDDYYNKFFGPASTPMKKFYSKIQETWNSGKWGKVHLYQRKKDSAVDKQAYFFAHNPWKILFTPEILCELSTYLKQAESIVEKNPMYKRRIKFIKDQFNFTLKKAIENGSQNDSDIQSIKKQLSVW